MAGGNLGDLWFQLGVKDNTSKELQKIIDKLKTGDDAANSLLRALQGFGTKKSGFKEQAEKAKEFADVLNEINRRISKLKKNDKSDEAKDLQMAVKNALSYLDMLQRINIERSKISELRSLNPNVDTSKLKEAELMLENVNNQLYRLQNKAQGGGGGGVDYANVLQDYAKVLQMTFRDVKQITDQFKKENPLSAFSGGAAKVEADISRVTEKLAKMRDLMAEGALKGYNTNMLGGSITELDKILARLQSASGNKSILTDAAQMKNLLSDVAVEMTKATAATQAYGREKGKAIAVEREFASAAKLSAKDNEAELKAQSDYIKRYMVLVEKKREIAEKAGISPFFKNDQGLKNTKAEIDTLLTRLGKVREDITLYQHAIGTGTKEGISFGQQGLKEANAEAEKLMGTITALQNVYDTLRVSQANVKDLIGQTPQKQRQDDIQKRMSEYYSNLEKTSKEKEAQATRDAAKAKREDIAAEKQRQNELKNTERRYDSIGNKVRQLHSEYSRGISIGADVSKAEDEIKRLISIMRHLGAIRDSLSSGYYWRSTLGELGNIGSGHDTTLASRVLQDQKAVNREVQRGIELEQKRQQEIAQTAAKVQSQLVRGFERANSHAGKLNSTVQDLKSLFLQGGLVFGAQQFAMSIITTGGEMEKQHIALQSILGDMQNANTMFNQIKELALNSPFTFSELNRDVKQLAAYGVEYDQLYDTTKRLADMSSGLGVSFDRIALAFGQVQARGWLDGKELRQIAYAGIPLLNKLSEFYSKQEGRNVSTSEIKTRISNREVSFDDVKSIFWQMTDAGGQFYNMQQVLSETLLGRYNKLKDAWEIMLAEFASGESLVGKFFKTAIEGATTLVQSLHSLALPAGTILAGYGLKKMLAGGVASNFLSNKASVAADIQKRVLMGQQISQVEQRILVTKNQITGADLRALANARALTTEKLNQLRLSGKITAEQYNIYRGIVLRQKGEKTVRMQMLRALATMRSMSLATTFSSVKNVWTAFQTSALAAFRIIGTGAKTLAAEIWSAIGGLPGLIITAVTFGVMHAISEYQELSQKIKQTQDEIADKNKQIRDFLRDNNVNIAISGGDTKEIDNMIDSYKEKLKELAPYSYKNMLMTADEKKSHADRLKYLEQEIKLLKEANDIANSKLSSRYYYSDLSDTTEEVVDAFKKREDMRIAAMAAGASSGDKTLYLDEKAFGNYIEKLKDELARKFGDIGKDERMREAAMQAMSGIFSSMGVPEDKADIIRTSILQAFGCGDKSAWLQTEVSNSMIALIDKSFPMIGEKIRASVPLNDAEKAKVRELMNDAKNGLIRQYPELERTLQNMLAASNFQAVIKLVIDGGDKLNDLQSELVKRIPGKYSGLMMSDISGQYKTYAERWGKENSWYSARNAANEDITKALNEYKSAKKSNAKNVKELYTKWQTVKQAALDLLNYDFDGEYKKSNKIPKGKKNTHVNQEDKELETLRKRIDLYKKFYSELEKYRKIYGDEGAMIQMRKDKEFKNSVLSWKLSDPGTYESSIRELMNRLPSSTQKRREYKESQLADIHAKNRSIEEERIRETNNMLSKRLNIISEQYKTYKKIYELTGNSKGASMLAFGYVQSGTYQDYLKEQMKWAVKEHNERTGQSLSADDVLKMNESDFNKHIGSESENASVIYKEWVEETARIKQETIDLLANLVEKNATIDQQIEDENRKYERQLELIKGIKDAGMRDRATEGAEKTHNENLAKLEFEKFKQESDWVTIFDDLDRVSSSTINSMIEKIDGFSKTTGLSVEVVKQLRDALGKLRDEQIDRNPIKGIVGGMQRGNAIGSFIGSRFRKGMDISTTTYVGSSDAKKMGIKEGNYTKGQLENEKKGAYDDANKGVSKLTDKFKALQDCLSPVISLFEVLGEEDSFLGQATNMASGAFGAAAQVSGGLNALGLGSIGPYGAAAGAALSVVTSLFAMHDKALQKEIEASEERQKELDNMTKNVKSIIEDALGGIYSYKERSDTKSTISKITSNYELADAWKKTGIGKSLPFLVKSVYSKETYEAAKEAQSKPGSAYHAELASLKAQKDELQSQRNSENEKKKKDNSKIADYDQQIKEMELQIDSFAKDFLKDIYSIDFKSWASELTDAVVGAWEKGEDAVEAYKEKVKDMVKDVTKNIVTQKIMEAALQKPLDYLTNILKDKGKLDETDMNQLADLLYKAGDEAIPQITGIFEALKKRGLDLRDNGSSSSTKNSIQSITEETADILASYLNAVRLDVSVIREMQGKFIPEMSEIAKSQLTQLNLIAQNTLRNADAAERIEKIFIEYNDNFNRVINGTKSLKMK
jgi:hypothetical protein